MKSITEMTDEEIANLSDEEFSKLEIPTSGNEIVDGIQVPGEGREDGAEGMEGGQESQEESSGGGDTREGENAAYGEDSGNVAEAANAGSETGEDAGQEGAGESPEEEPAETEGEEAGDTDGEHEAGEAEEGEKGEDKESDESDDFDYKAAYEKMMTPFKANGKEIKLENPEELIKLAQMGANYTKKLQALQPNLKVVRMLENNGLLADENKLNFLVDLAKGNPEAVRKAVKDAGIDPLDIDTSEETKYQPNDHRVSDEEWRFTSTLEDIQSNPAGRELIGKINETWDEQSKNALWSDPNIMRVLTTHKESGVYDAVADEIERLQTLGQIQGTSFLTAYEQVARDMEQQGKLQQTQATDKRQQGQKAPAEKSTQRVVETRTAKRKTVSNSDKARAASSPQSVPQKRNTDDFNPLAMSDEEFMKNEALARKL